MTKNVTKKIAFIIVALVMGAGLVMGPGLVMGTGLMAFSRGSAPDTKAAVKESPERVKPAQSEDFLNYDMVVGAADAPVEIIEYAAISCPHCAHFHEDIFPQLKKEYLDTGKAKLIYRNFIFNNPFDVFASALTRCTAKTDFFPMVKSFFDSQHLWNNIPELRRVLKAEGQDAAMKYAQDEVGKVAITAGMSPEQVEKCYNNEAVITYLITIRQTAVGQYGVNSTPTIFVDGKKLEGYDFAAIKQAIDLAKIKLTK